MTERDPSLEPFEALIGTWATEATHPLFDGVVPGSVTFEWLQGGHFVVPGPHTNHERFPARTRVMGAGAARSARPDPLAVIGAPEAGDGLVNDYVDSRGLRLTLRVVGDGGGRRS